MTDAQRPVLVAATDPDAVTAYRSWLTGQCRVETTTDGEDFRTGFGTCTDDGPACTDDRPARAEGVRERS
ncbi:transcriptional regulator [Natrinema mahii]|nr:transcriptional regulator [Natrinema mahii]